jgi:hypothetical protein
MHNAIFVGHHYQKHQGDQREYVSIKDNLELIKRNGSMRTRSTTIPKDHNVA